MAAAEGGAVENPLAAAVLIPSFAFLLGGVAQSFVPTGAGAAETAKRVGKVPGAWLLGLFGIGVLFVLAVV